MSTLLEQASLVMIPSGYKEDVVYSQIPTSGAGDLSFTRASNGTRINSAGLVEVCPWNMLSNSEQFTTANGWFANTTGGSTASQTSDYGVAPNGTTTADRIQLALNGGSYADWVIVPTLPIVVGQVYTYSMYMKSLTGTTTLQFLNDASGGITKTITTEWVRYDYTFTATNVQIYPRFLIGSGTSTSADLLAWGAQLNIGSTAKPYFPTTDRLNVPRLTYQNGGGGCPSLLLEKQSTNLLSYSQDLTGASWTTVANTLTANYATSPDGTSNSTRIIPTTTNSTHINYQTFSVSSATSITAFAKADGYNFFQIYGGDAAGGPLRYSVVVNLSNGTIDTIDTIASNQVVISAMGNGWYKITISNFTSFTSGSSFIGIAAIPSSGLSRNSNLDVIFAGNGTSGVLAWGIQCEQSSYATSYIPTTSSSATRVADACFKTGISSLIGQTEGTMFIDVSGPSKTGDARYIGVSNGTDTNRILLYSSNLTTVSLYWQSPSGSGQINFTAINGRMKMAAAYKNNDLVVYCNGELKTSTTSAPISMTLNTLFVGTYEDTTIPNSLDQSVNEAVLFKTRLSNSELASLTTI